MTTVEAASAYEVMLERTDAAQPLGMEHLVRPVAVDAFLEQHWGRAAGYYPASIAGRTGEVLDLPSFEHVLATLPRANEGWLHLARETARPVPASMLDAEGMLRLPEIRAAFRDGETLYLTKAHRLSASLMQLSRAVEVDLATAGMGLRAPVSAHVFLTPPASRGFQAHRDAHHSLILQLHGSKEWTVYDDGDSADIPRQLGPVGPGTPPGERLSFTLTPGDVLYVPQWWVHAARASDVGSLHVTLRMFPLRWIDVLTAVLPSLPALDRPLRRGFGHAPDDAADDLVRLMQRPDVRGDLLAATRLFLQRSAVPDTALPDDGLGSTLAAHALEPTSWLVKSAGVTCTVTSRPGEVTLGFPGGSVSAPAALEPVFRDVAVAARLRPVDLPAVDGDYDRVALAGQLVMAGILTVDKADAGGRSATSAPT